MADIELRGTAGSGGTLGELNAFHNGAPYVGPVTIAGSGVATPPGPVPVAFDDAAAFTYTGTWQVATDSQKFGGTERYSDVMASSARIVLETGAAGHLRVFGAKDVHHGVFLPTIDDKLDAGVSCYAPVRAETQLLWETDLGAGTHTVELVVMATHKEGSTGNVVALDKVEITDLVKLTPPAQPPPATPASAAVGMVWTSDSPLPDVWSPIPLSMSQNLGRTCGWHNQHVFRAFRSPVGDRRGRPLNWAGLRKCMQDIASCGAANRMLTAYNCAVDIIGAADYDWNTQRPPSTDAQIEQYAQDVYDAVKEGLHYGFFHLAVWNELKGMWNDFKLYTKIYNAIWRKVKGDPATAIVKIYGPYCIFTNHQDNRWGGELNGPWGGIDPAVTNGFKYFLGNALGCDGFAIDMSMGDIDGNTNGGNYNPRRLPQETQELYYFDVPRWVRRTVDAIPKYKGLPILAMEAYWGAADRWIKVFNNFRNGGGNVFLIWHGPEPGVAGQLVTPGGILTSLGAAVLDERGVGAAAKW